MYVELHARSAFSFLEGASTPEALIAACAAYGMPSMALLDRDGLYGAPRFYLAAKKAGLQAHIGAEVSCLGGWRYPLLVAMPQGYHNLCCLITRMKLRSKKGQGAIEARELEEFSSGLICLTGGREGPLAHALRAGGKAKAKKCLEELCATFGKHNVYVELQRHFSIEEERRNQTAIELAGSMHLPLLATNGVCHVAPQDRELLDVFTCIRHHRVLSNAGGLLSANSERYFKSSAQMAMLFADLPEAIRNTEVLASRLLFTLKDLGYQFPSYPTPNHESQIAFLRKRTLEGMIQRYGANDQNASRQIEHELSVIQKLDLAGYFLIVWDIVRFCREKNILVQGRGSAANSAVCYSLGITAVDPVGMNLLFERFLSEQRGEWPDIDLDLPSGDQRERVIQYVYERYGKLGAAMTANVITYRGKSAAREVGKVLSFDSETLDRLASLVSAWEYTDSKDTLTRQFQDAGLDLGQHRIGKFFELCQKVQDLPRHLGQHSGGMVVCQGQLNSVVPLEPATMPGRVVVQWDKEDCADMGIVKVDLLGLGMMAVLEDSLQLIRRHHGEEIDLGHLPQNDPAVYSALERADTIGLFQVESRAQMSCLPRLKPKCFYDIVVQVAIIRPGPIVGKMVHPYLNRRQGREPAVSLHPLLESTLSRTLGVPLFQEQLLRIAMIAAGFSGGEAEELRRAFGFKRSEARMKEVEIKLRRGMEAKGITGETQDRIIQAITSFALYGFPESHAASFALIAYASAFLKCHYLAAFTAAMLNNQPMGFYQPATLIKDAQRHGLQFKPIDVTCSDWDCTLEEGSQGLRVRIGLRYVKTLSKETALEIVAQRDARPLASIEDLKQRVPQIQKDEFRALASVGALNFISGKAPVHRRTALWQVESASRPSGPLFKAQQKDADAEGSSFSSPLEPMNREERITADFRGTAITLGAHPLAQHRSRLDRQGVVLCSRLASLPDGTFVSVAGAVIARQRPGTAKGFVFLSLEDETGIANIIIAPPLFEKEHTTVVHQSFLIVRGTLQNQDGVISVKAGRIEPFVFLQTKMSSHDFH
ncbi:MAG: error-prone DNA polymerase [Acidobacteria bacterium]|nr:MAG: error-prone DNA polymerase [Acidobacteriota bacterium]PYU70173.1 MAG: error-prone DNA polymerase [Acidobacteriota bacterium]